MMRDSPPELALACAGPYASMSTTFLPRLARCQAAHAPKTPAPITATSYLFVPFKVFASYRNLCPGEKRFHPVRHRVTIWRFAPDLGGLRESVSLLFSDFCPCSHCPFSGLDCHARAATRRFRFRLSHRFEILCRHEVAPDRSVSRRPGLDRRRSPEPAEYLLLWRRRRRRLENHGRWRLLGSALREADHLFHWQHRSRGFRSQRHLRGNRRSLYPRKYLLWRRRLSFE